jgi:hypothetical protein
LSEPRATARTGAYCNGVRMTRRLRVTLHRASAR